MDDFEFGLIVGALIVLLSFAAVYATVQADRKLRARAYQEWYEARKEQE